MIWGFLLLSAAVVCGIWFMQDLMNDDDMVLFIVVSYTMVVFLSATIIVLSIMLGGSE